MKTKKQRTLYSRLWISMTLVLCILFSSFPAYAISADTEHFIGLEDIEVEEGTQVSLLEQVSAYDAAHDSLEVKVTSVVCQTDEAFVYDGTDLLTVGEAGSRYVVEYSATAPEDENVSYTGYRNIVSTAASETEEVPEQEELETEAAPETEPESEQEEPSEIVFDENQPFTISDLEGMGYSVQMDGAQIPVGNFKLECLNEKAGEVPCDDLHFDKGITYIEGGKIKEHAPAYVTNKAQKLHSYVKAHVGEVAVYYMGTLHIEDGETSADYVYYTTDTQITNKTVYAVLKKEEQEKITFTYAHEAENKVEYQMFEKGSHEEQGPDGWSYSDVFGENRAIFTKKGADVSFNIQIPRGYKAEISVTRTGQTPEHKELLGEMMAYETDENNKNLIKLKKDSATSMSYNTSFTIKSVDSDLVVTVEYEKVPEITFNAYMWTQTQYAQNRISVHDSDEKPSEKTAILTSTDHSFVWEWDGRTSRDGSDHFGGTEGQPTDNTWELDQLELNGEALIIPMVSLNDENKTITEKTTLSTGTEVTLSVTTEGGTNGRDERRHYKLQIDNCYEDITISGGNMVSHRHQEYAIRELSGVKNAGYYAYDGSSQFKWHEMEQDTLIGKMGKNEWTDPMRFQRETGFYKPEISFTTKEGDMLQSNDKIGLDEDQDKEPYIEYLIRTDGKEDGEGSYDTVKYSDWKASPDGYYYFRGTEEVKEFVGKKWTEGGYNPENAYKGVILININAYPIRIGLDYLNGADEEGKTAPKGKNIANLPETQYGGKDGYNLVNNPKLLMSNMVPVDLENEFVFDHWEVQETARGNSGDQFWGYLTGNPKLDEEGNCYTALSGQEYHLDVPMLNELENCFYMKGDADAGQTNGNPFNDKPHKGAQTHAMITVRAVWRKQESKPTIPYTVKYITAEVKDGKIDTGTEKIIEERTHTVNQGAMLVTDLYQDGNKTPSASIQAVLGGENDARQDYTNSGEIRWLVYEPKTTKMIESVDMKNNVAIIYLIKGNTKVNVEKVWTSAEHLEPEVTVQLQRRKSESSPWEKVENVLLNENNKWEYQFDVDAYYNYNSLNTWQYRVVEINANGGVIEDGKNITINDHTYQAGYRYDNDKHAWVIQNTRLLNLTISKVVEGKYGDRTKDFTFDIQATDSEGKPLNGTYAYTGSVKQDNGNQTQQPPQNSTLTFQAGKAQIQLKHSQQITIEDLPVNAKIVVTEQDYKDYKTSYTVNAEKKDKGELTLIKDSSVDVTNEKSDIAETGITNSIGGSSAGLGIALMAVIAFGALAFLRLKKGQKK